MVARRRGRFRVGDLRYQPFTDHTFEEMARMRIDGILADAGAIRDRDRHYLRWRPLAH